MEKTNIYKKPTFNQMLRNQTDDRKALKALRILKNTEAGFINEINQLLDQYNFN